MRVRLLLSCVASWGAVSAVAQPGPGPGTKAGGPAEPLPPIFAPRPPSKDAGAGGVPRPVSAAPAASRAISPGMAAKLSEVVLRVAPPAGGMPPAGGDGPLPAGIPAGVVQLERYIVQEDRMPAFKERDMLTPKGILALARRRYPGLGPLSDGAALALLAEDFAKERRQEMVDLRGLLEIDGTQVPRELKRKLEEATMRPSSFDR